MYVSYVLVQLALLKKQQFTVRSWQKTSLKQVMSTEIQSCWVARNFPWKKERRSWGRCWEQSSLIRLLTYLLPLPSCTSPGCKKFPLMKWPHGTHFSRQSQVKKRTTFSFFTKLLLALIIHFSFQKLSKIAKDWEPNL